MVDRETGIRSFPLGPCRGATPATATTLMETVSQGTAEMSTKAAVIKETTAAEKTLHREAKATLQGEHPPEPKESRSFGGRQKLNSGEP